MSVVQIVRMEAARGNAVQLLGLLKDARDFTLTVQGCQAFDIYQGKDNSHQFIMIERWTSTDAQQAHFERNVMATGLFERVSALLIGAPELSYYLPR